MKIIDYIADHRLEAIFRGHTIVVEKEPEHKYYGNWYMYVTDCGGHVCCDGWIDDSSSIGIRNAFNQACDGALIKPPKRWSAAIT